MSEDFEGFGGVWGLGVSVERRGFGLIRGDGGLGWYSREKGGWRFVVLVVWYCDVGGGYGVVGSWRRVL